MTTRKFSATDLPHPRYSLEVGRFSIRSKEQQKQKQVRGAREGTSRKRSTTSTSTHSSGAVVDGGDNHDDHDDNDEQDDDDGGVGIGCGSGDVNLPSTCLPRFSQLAQVVEVRLPGCTLPGRVNSNIKDFLGSYCVIENARPELFVRRDFISKFVAKGTIQICQLSSSSGGGSSSSSSCHAPSITTTTTTATSTQAESSHASTTNADGGGYKLGTTRDNVMTITMNAKQYHRFGMVATTVISSAVSAAHKKTKRRRTTTNGGSDDIYRVEISLVDERIRECNKFQDKLIGNLRRLDPISKVYFRFIPDKCKLNLPTAQAASELACEFFNFVIDEYAQDGCQPVPLTKCYVAGQRVERNWINYRQLHPPLSVSQTLAALGPLIGRNKQQRLNQQQRHIGGLVDGERCMNSEQAEKTESALSELVSVADWLGYQLLRLDCDKLDELELWECATDDRVDVSCTQIIGNIDSKQVQANLGTLFKFDDEAEDHDLLLRALILYNGQYNDSLELCMNNHLVRKEGDPVDIDLSQNVSNNNNCGVIYLQDYGSGSKSEEITVLGMSKLSS